MILDTKSSIDNSIDFSRELSSLLREQGNLHYSQIYKAVELQLKRKQKFNGLNWLDRCILCMNNLSNGHGTKPQNAFYCMLGLVFIFWLILTFDLGFEAGLDFFKSNYLYFIKPWSFLHEIEDNSLSFGSDNMKCDFKWYTLTFEVVYKFLYAYLVYQFIAAFRKFNK